MFGREPAVIIAAVMALVQAAGIFLLNDASWTPEMFLALITLVVGPLIRPKVIPVAKVEEAGYSSEGIAAQADMNAKKFKD